MATRQFIPPFPADIDRNHFSSWLSGFVDGEGCFMLAQRLVRNHTIENRMVFTLGVRDDDRPVLELIQSYFQCGRISKDPVKKMLNAKPSSRFVITSMTGCLLLIDHFDRYPLLAKKSRDFAIWKTGIELVTSIANRKGGHRNRKWTGLDHQKFRQLSIDLKAVRNFTTTPIPDQLFARCPELAQHSPELQATSP